MTKFLTTIILSIFLTVPFQSFAQNKVCGSYKGYIQYDIHQYPEFYKSISQKNQNLKQDKLKEFIQLVVHVKLTQNYRRNIM